jgi:hypothetical protein
MITLPSGKLKRIHVNRQKMAKNRKQIRQVPVIGIEVSGMKKMYGHTVEIQGSSVVKQRDVPLKCGARAWVETRGAVTILFDQSKKGGKGARNEETAAEAQVGGGACEHSS